MMNLDSLIPVDGPELHFDRAEYDRRVARTRELMQAEGIDALVVSNPSNILYLTGYATTMPSGYARLIIPAEGEVRVHCSEVEAPSFLCSSTVTADQIELFEWTNAHECAVELARLISGLGFDGKRVGLEMGQAENFAIGALDARSYIALTQTLPNATFVDATGVVLEVRLIKTAKELEYMREAGRITWAGLQAGLNAIHDGTTDNQVIAAVYNALKSEGSEAASIDPMIISGPRTGWMPHVPYENKPIVKGDPVYFEITGTHHRYNAPSMRTAVVGEPSPGVKQLAQANIDTINALLGSIKPGRTGHDVAVEVSGPLASVPDAWFHGGYGYSIGLGTQPTWTEAPMYIAEGCHRELQPGMTFHLAVCSLVPSKFGAGFSESIVITEDGCETLTPYKDFRLTIR